ncbi:hypothetical protein XM38_002500 [Halomicronema hongdechloris C2206]|uniref:Uncharacterized protein n=1 Tax=Halomicronema hongdechloris C2206 TaxID=1641165 RepID=A0A1Z3HG96_9CYAN|nr:hypothetical protein [Halomicronema hongdechloris]ASC69323.1 hypothetical protein XM38_002500 [Halomicronema hongdechloris C2206]
MAIDPYEPELAKRQKAFQIATRQLNSTVQRASSLANNGSELKQSLAMVFEAMEDYRQTGVALADWLQQHQQKQ